MYVLSQTNGVLPSVKNEKRNLGTAKIDVIRDKKPYVYPFYMILFQNT